MESKAGGIRACYCERSLWPFQIRILAAKLVQGGRELSPAADQKPREPEQQNNKQSTEQNPTEQSPEPKIQKPISRNHSIIPSHRGGTARGCQLNNKQKSKQIAQVS